jgi:hypothetical protein
MFGIRNFSEVINSHLHERLAFNVMVFNSSAVNLNVFPEIEPATLVLNSAFQRLSWFCPFRLQLIRFQPENYVKGSEFFDHVRIIICSEMKGGAVYMSPISPETLLNVAGKL